MAMTAQGFMAGRPGRPAIDSQQAVKPANGAGMGLACEISP